MKLKRSQGALARFTPRREHRLHSAVMHSGSFTSAAMVALAVVINLSAVVQNAQGEDSTRSFGPATAIATARQVAADRPSEYLEGLQPAERGHVILEVETADSAVWDSSIRSSMVESLWREGRYDDAVNLLRTLEDQELLASVGFNWQAPRRTVNPHDAKSSIDGTGGAGQVELAHDPDSGNLFALVRWGGSWGLFISSDQGASWSESFHFSGMFLIGMKVDLELHNSAIHGDFAYVAYSYNGNLTGTTAVARVRRFAAANGAHDESWGIITPHTDEARDFKEIDLAVGEWIDYVILRDDGRILDLVGVISNPGLTWFNQDTDVTDADRGLAVACPGADADYIGLFITYISSYDRVSMARRALPSGFLPFIHLESPPQPWADKTSIATNGDIAIVAWECQPNDGSYQGVRTKRIVATSTFANGIERFDGSELYAPGIDLHDPLVAGSGNAIVYTSGSEVHYRERTNYIANWSTDPLTLNHQGIVPGDGHAFAFEWLGSGYGIAYFDTQGDVYFNTIADASGVMFIDGFDSGDLSKWSLVVN